MTLTDLEGSLKSLLASGQLGTPVALRIQAVLPEKGNDPLNGLVLFTPLVRLVSDDSQGRVQAQAHSSGKQVSVLWTDARGRTVFISVASVPGARQTLQVLLMGNHGIARLSGGEFWTESIPGEQSPLWAEEIRESLKRGTSIAVGLS